MNAHTTTLVMALSMLLPFTLLFVGAMVAWMVTDNRAPIGATHHCHPGTCPLCDSFGTWQD